jgi:gliding motility-associated-like protein
MKELRCIIWIVFFFCSIFKLTAQNYIEFVENKGQWDGLVAFKGELSTGSFILKPDGGYKVILHSQDDLKTIAEYFHGGYSGANTGTNKKIVMESVEKKGGVSSSTSLLLHSHAYEVTFLNSNPHPVIIKEKSLDTYNNYYFGNDSAKWVSGCKVYQAITYKDIYPNIDVRYYTNNDQLKYDLIVHPGGNVHNIALYFAGVDGLKLKDGSLIIKTSVQEVKESMPTSYLLKEAGKKDIPCRFDLKGNIIQFAITGPGPAVGETMVIDPVLIFCSFTGSTGDNWGYTATYDGAGNFYAGGIIFGATGSFNPTNGAYQKNFSGGNGNSGEGAGFDIGIIKFDPSGAKKLYATYLGGTGNEQPHSMVTDAAGNLIVAGRTTSADFPSSFPNPGKGGGWDIILAKFNPAGGKIGFRVIGGTGDDGVNIRPKYVSPTGPESIDRNYGDDGRSEVIVDGAGNIYLASCTQSTDFPVVNAFQTVNGGNNINSGRMQDGVVIKTNSSLSTILFSTYLGGKGDDAAFVLALNPLNNNIYVAGSTASTDLPGDKNGTIYPSYHKGLCNGFVSVISNNGSKLIKTSYFGSSNVADTVSATSIYGIQFDKFGFPYIMGTSTGVWPVINASFSQTGGKQFIAKLQADLSAFVYATIFGSNSSIPNISPTAFLVDRCENIYVSGWGGQGNTRDGFLSSGTRGLTTTADALQPTTDIIGSDFYFFVMGRDAKTQLYGSFFGQKDQTGEKTYPDHVDGGTSRFDRNGIIYQAVCANCGGGVNFPTTAGAWSVKNGAINPKHGAGCNLAAIKLAFNLAGVAAGIRSSINGKIRDTSGCLPVSADFTDTMALAKQYIWDFGDGFRDTTITPSNSHYYKFLGTYRVMLIGVDSGSCNIYDTSYVTMHVRDDHASLSLNAAKIPPCTSLTYQFNNGSIPPLGKPFQANSFQIDFGDGYSQLMGTDSVQHTYLKPGTYNVGLVLLDTNYCNQADSFALQIRITPQVKAQFITPALGCIPYTAVFDNTSLGGLQFIWDFGDGGTSTKTNPTHLYSAIGSYTVKLVALDSTTCNKMDSTFFTINTQAKPTAGFTASPQPPFSNTAIDFTNNSLGGSSYKWFFGDGDSVLTSDNVIVSHIYNATGTFNVCLITFNQEGCSDTSCHAVQALITPLFDVPNAFSPNGDGVNDKIFVKGFGIGNMQWKIYNRWGTLVFQSSSKNTGWNGFYNGNIQPQDVYHYILEVKMTDGSRYTKKGDITLLR